MSLMRYRCRKATCRTRKTLKQPIDWYRSRPKCPSCKQDTLTLDAYRMKNEVNGHRATCNCDGYRFPHNPNSLWCEQSTIEPTEQQYSDRYDGGNELR